MAVAAQQCGGSHPTIRQLPHNNTAVATQQRVSGRERGLNKELASQVSQSNNLRNLHYFIGRYLSPTREKCVSLQYEIHCLTKFSHWQRRSPCGRTAQRRIQAGAVVVPAGAQRSGQIDTAANALGLPAALGRNAAV